MSFLTPTSMYKEPDQKPSNNYISWGYILYVFLFSGIDSVIHCFTGIRFCMHASNTKLTGCCCRE